MATRTWNGSTWGTMPVGGDTVDSSSSTPPTGADKPVAAGAYTVSISNGVELNAEDLVPAVGATIASITVGHASADITVTTMNFGGGTISPGTLYIAGDLTSTGNIDLSGGTLHILQNVTFTAAFVPGIDLDLYADAVLVVNDDATFVGSIYLQDSAAASITLHAGATIRGNVSGADTGSITWTIPSEAPFARLIIDQQHDPTNLGAATLTNLEVVIAIDVTMAEGLICRSLEIGGGFTLDMNGEVLEAGGTAPLLICGGGTLANVVSAQGVLGAEGIRDGGGNTGGSFQYGKSGTACTTGTAT